MKIECHGSIGIPAFTERECAGAHRMHQTHYSWARSAMSSDPTACYQCHIFARVAIAAADESHP